MKALLYCTKAKPYLVKDYDLYGEFIKYKTTEDLTNFQSLNGLSKKVNGLIVAECDIDKVDIIRVENQYATWEETYCFLENNPNFDLYKASCLDEIQISNYLDKGKGYALRLSNVKVFDKLKDINSFYANHCIDKYGITSCDILMKAPQNMMNVCNSQGNRYVLISIQPQWLCKILNGEKTIEVRKQILNCLKEMI